MLTLLGSIIGFLSSILPQILKTWQSKQDQKQELAIMDRQIENQKLLHDQKMQAINLNADISQNQAIYSHDSNLKGSNWIESLRASIRPIITYCFFLLFSFVKIGALYWLIFINEVQASVAIQEIWDEETQILFSAVISFWFGSRSINNRK